MPTALCLFSHLLLRVVRIYLHKVSGGWRGGRTVTRLMRWDAMHGMEEDALRLTTIARRCSQAEQRAGMGAVGMSAPPTLMSNIILL